MKGDHLNTSSGTGLTDAEISVLVGVSHPKEATTSFTEMVTSEKSPAHLQAIEEVNQFKEGLINATELRKRHSKTYKNWDDMKQRSRGNPEKGIPPIDRHPSFDSFSDFLVLSGPRPFLSWSIDRIDPEGPYSPDNCRWASKKTQSRNRTNTVKLTYEGVTRPLVEWAEIEGEDPNTFRVRKRNGWSDEEVIEGKRKSGFRNQTSHDSRSRNPFDYTPWPIKIRENLEKAFQHEGRVGEHRLAFMKRYAALQIELLSTDIEDLSWPEYYEPSIEEAGKEIEVRREYMKWQSIYSDACRKLKNVNLPLPYLKLQLPPWVVQQLRNYA